MTVHCSTCGRKALRAAAAGGAFYFTGSGSRIMFPDAVVFTCGKNPVKSIKHPPGCGWVSLPYTEIHEALNHGHKIMRTRTADEPPSPVLRQKVRNR